MQREKKPSPKEPFGMCLSRFATSCSFNEQRETRKTWKIFASASTTVEHSVRSMLYVPPTRVMFDYERLQFSNKKKF